MELFEKLKDNFIWDAQIVGKNLFCQKPNEETIFNEYFSFCIKIATYPVEIETRTFFINEAELALNVFSEKCNIDESKLKIIQDARSELVAVSRKINEDIQSQTDEQGKSSFEANNKVLSELSKLKSEMLHVVGQAQFDDVLKKMSDLEESLDKTILDKHQTALYNSLTRDFSTLISQKMTEITHCEDIKYKKSDRELYGLVSGYLFAFDAKRLFNECLVYYNHVYSYIFNKLDDDGKFRFTQFSFDTPKEQ